MKKSQQNNSSSNTIIMKKHPFLSSQSFNETKKKFPYSYHQVTDHAYLINLFEKLPAGKQETVIEELLKEIPGISINKTPNEKEDDYRLRCFTQLLIKLQNHDDFFNKKFDLVINRLLEDSKLLTRKPVLKDRLNSKPHCFSSKSASSADVNDDQESNLKLDLLKAKSFHLRSGANSSRRRAVGGRGAFRASLEHAEYEFLPLTSAPLADTNDDQDSNLKLELFKVKSFDLRGGVSGSSGGGGGAVEASSSKNTSSSKS